MTFTAEELTELRKATKTVSKDVPILKSGKKGAIELDPKNPLHREWYEGSNVADNLARGKAVLKCKNGVVQIDKDHPNYDFWMED